MPSRCTSPTASGVGCQKPNARTSTVSPAARSSLPGSPARKALTMKIPRDKVLDVLRLRGHDDQVEQAAAELPKHLDTDKDHELLEKYHVTAKDFVQL